MNRARRDGEGHATTAVVTIAALVATVFVSATPTSSASTPALSLTRMNETARFAMASRRSSAARRRPRCASCCPTSSVRNGHKNGFCVIDIENIWFGRHGDAPRTYYFPQCQAPTETGAYGPVLRQGMSVGWADIYNWFLPGQYIEVSGLPDVYYLLDTFADADGLVLEANETNNVTTALIRICGDSADIVGEGTSCL